MNSPRKRVLVLTTRLPVEVGDGTPAFVLETAVALKEDYRITILAPRVFGSTRMSSTAGIPVQRFAYFPKRWERLADQAIPPQLANHPMMWLQAASLTASMLCAALYIARKERFDLVHAHWVVPAGLVAFVTRLVWRIPFIVTLHGSDVFTLNAHAVRWLKRQIVERADGSVVSSSLMQNKLGTTGAVVQPAGIDSEYWGQVAGQRDPEQGRILFVGRLARNKGAHIAVESLASLPNAVLRIVGDGPERHSLECLAEDLGVAGRVVFLGHNNREQVAEEYRRATCVVIPSLIGPDGSQEGTPSVLGEAAACGVPIVASKLSGLADLVTHGSDGMLIAPNDPNALSESLLLLTNDEDLQVDLARTARRRLVPLLSINRSADLYRSLFARAVREDGA